MQQLVILSKLDTPLLILTVRLFLCLCLIYQMMQPSMNLEENLHGLHRHLLHHLISGRRRVVAELSGTLVHLYYNLTA